MGTHVRAPAAGAPNAARPSQRQARRGVPVREQERQVPARYARHLHGRRRAAAPACAAGRGNGRHRQVDAPRRARGRREGAVRAQKSRARLVRGGGGGARAIARSDHPRAHRAAPTAQARRG